MTNPAKILLGNLKTILSFGSSNANKNIVTDESGNLKVEDKSNHTHLEDDIIGYDNDLLIMKINGSYIGDAYWNSDLIGNNITVDYGDGTIQNTKKLQHTYSETGEYIIKVKGVTSLDETCLCYQGITDVIIPDGITTIGAGCFGYSPVKNIIFPESLTMVQNSAFYNCSGLKNLIFRGKTPPTNYATSTIPSNCTISVPNDSLQLYRNAQGFPSNCNYVGLSKKDFANEIDKIYPIRAYPIRSLYSMVESKANINHIHNNYIEKNETEGLVKNNGEIDTNIYLTEHQDISGKANLADLATVAITGDYNDLNNIPQSTGDGNTSNLATIATTGSYYDLKDIPPFLQGNSFLKIKDEYNFLFNNNPTSIGFRGQNINIGGMFYTARSYVSWGDGTFGKVVYESAPYVGYYILKHNYKDNTFHEIQFYLTEFDGMNGLRSFELNNVTSISFSELIKNFPEYCLEASSTLNSITFSSNTKTINGNFINGGVFSNLQSVSFRWKNSSDILPYNNNWFKEGTGNFTIYVPRDTTQLYIDKGYPEEKLKENYSL